MVSSNTLLFTKILSRTTHVVIQMQNRLDHSLLNMWDTTIENMAIEHPKQKTLNMEIVVLLQVI
jgi:hypothetical protein